ncbi:hypothetical protein ACIBCA_19635 [Kitasatospora sp. NPDC051170]|uniref:hypothetical protein n=1 Tax=Kitasatospora sp. NPDC051170 TaxID=3364056 RepID=UPI0037873C74
MDCDDVMLTVRTAAAERALLRDLARGHGGDVSEVAVDGLLEIVPALHDVSALHDATALLPLRRSGRAGAGVRRTGGRLKRPC